MKYSLLVLGTVLTCAACAPSNTPTPLSSSPLSTTAPTPVQPMPAATLGLFKILPSFYEATPGDNATDSNLRYIDETGQQLTDGTRGQNVYNANISGTPSSEWVGWLNKDPTMTFRFAQSQRIEAITIGFSHTEYAGIALPKNVFINGKVFALQGSEVPLNRRGDVTFKTNITSNEITIKLERNPNFRWIFVDEITFMAVR